MSHWKTMTPRQKEMHRERTRRWHKKAFETNPVFRAKRQADSTRRSRDERKRNPLKRLWVRAKSRAAQSGMEFSIELADLSMPEFCPVLGIKITPSVPRHNGSPSLDRFDNSKGYIKGNVRVISFRANALKGSATVEEARLILAYMEGRR